MKNNLVFTIGTTTLITLGALGLALTGDKKEELKIEDSIYYDSGFAIRNVYQEIIWEATDMVEYQNVVNAVNEKVEEDKRRALEEQRLLEEKRKQEELKRKQEEQRKKKEAEQYNTSVGTKTDLGTFNVSFYTANCYKCSGISKAGVDLRKSIKYQGYGVVASDWSQIPAYSIIEIEGLGQYIVLDTGGRITTGHLDVLVKTKEEAYKLGRQYLNVKVIRWGKGK